MTQLRISTIGLTYVVETFVLAEDLSSWGWEILSTFETKQAAQAFMQSQMEPA